MAPSAAAAAAKPAVDPLEAAKKVADALRREKPALASALEKAESAVREGDDLVLTLSTRDRFQGEVVLKDREMLLARFSAVLPGLVKLRLAYREVTAEAARVDERVELVKKVFRGEIVKGEDHGEQPV